MAGVPVEQAAMRGFVQQALLLELAVDLDQFPAQPPEQAGRNGCIVHEGAGPPIPAQCAAQDQFVGRVDFQVPKRGCRLFRGRVETGSDICPVRANPDKPAIGPRTQGQAERIQQNRLARAGLAGKHGEARSEREFQPFDQHHIADSKPAQHGGRALSLGSRRRRLGRRLRRSTSPSGAFPLQ